MSRRKAGRALPGKPARFFAALSGWLLTLLLTGTIACLLGTHFLTSESFHEKVATDGRVVAEQQQRIREEVVFLGEKYGFDPETVMSQITDEDIRNVDREASQWLTGAFREGKLRETPAFQTDRLEAALMEDASFVASQDPYMLRNTVSQIGGEIRKTVTESAILFREILLRAAEKKAGKAIHLPTLAALLREIHVILLLACTAIAGLIALLTSRRMTLCLRYIGAAMISTGLILLVGMGLIALLDIGKTLNEISGAAFQTYRLLSIYMAAETGGAALLMLICGTVGSRMARRIMT